MSGMVEARPDRLVRLIRALCEEVGAPPEDVALIVLSPPWRLTATVYERDERGEKFHRDGDIATRSVVRNGDPGYGSGMVVLDGGLGGVEYAEEVPS